MYIICLAYLGLHVNPAQTFFLYVRTTVSFKVLQSMSTDVISLTKCTVVVIQSFRYSNRMFICSH